MLLVTISSQATSLASWPVSLPVTLISSTDLALAFSASEDNSSSATASILLVWTPPWSPLVSDLDFTLVGFTLGVPLLVLWLARVALV